MRLWFRSCARALDQCLHGRLFQAASALSVSHVDPSSSNVNCGPDVVCRFPRPSHSRFWVWPVGAMVFFLKVAPRHLALPSSCPFCDAPHGDMFHCLSECAAFSDLREQWCRRCSVHPDSVPFWVRHPWLFNPTSSFNTFRTVLAHVTFTGQACERFVSLSCSFQLFSAMGSAACLSCVAAFSSSPQGAPQHLAVVVSSPSVLPARAPQPLAVVSLVHVTQPVSSTYVSLMHCTMTILREQALSSPLQ